MKDPQERSIDVFISYCRKDRESATRLRTSLEEAGLRCWLDTEIPPGSQAYEEEILRALKRSKCFVLLASGHSAKSMYVANELRLAQEGNLHIFPIWLEHIDPLPSVWAFRIMGIQRLEAFEGISSKVLQDLQRAIASKLGGAPANLADDPTDAKSLSGLLTAARLEHLLDRFSQHGVTLDDIPHLTDMDLTKLGVEKIGERARLRRICGTTPAPAAATAQAEEPAEGIFDARQSSEPGRHPNELERIELAIDSLANAAQPRDSRALTRPQAIAMLEHDSKALEERLEVARPSHSGPLETALLPEFVGLWRAKIALAELCSSPKYRWTQSRRTADRMLRSLRNCPLDSRWWQQADLLERFHLNLLSLLRAGCTREVLDVTEHCMMQLRQREEFASSHATQSQLNLPAVHMMCLLGTSRRALAMESATGLFQPSSVQGEMPAVPRRAKMRDFTKAASARSPFAAVAAPWHAESRLTVLQWLLHEGLLDAPELLCETWKRQCEITQPEDVINRGLPPESVVDLASIAEASLKLLRSMRSADSDAMSHGVVPLLTKQIGLVRALQQQIGKDLPAGLLFRRVAAEAIGRVDADASLTLLLDFARETDAPTAFHAVIETALLLKTCPGYARISDRKLSEVLMIATDELRLGDLSHGWSLDLTREDILTLGLECFESAPEALRAAPEERPSGPVTAEHRCCQAVDRGLLPILAMIKRARGGHGGRIAIEEITKERLKCHFPIINCPTIEFEAKHGSFHDDLGASVKACHSLIIWHGTPACESIAHRSGVLNISDCRDASGLARLLNLQDFMRPGLDATLRIQLPSLRNLTLHADSAKGWDRDWRYFVWATRVSFLRLNLGAARDAAPRSEHVQPPLMERSNLPDSGNEPTPDERDDLALEVSGLPCLQRLELDCESNAQVSIKDLEGLKTLRIEAPHRRMQRLTIVRCPELEALEIAHSPNLRALVIDNCRNLRYLDVRNCRNLCAAESRLHEVPSLTQIVSDDGPTLRRS